MLRIKVIGINKHFKDLRVLIILKGFQNLKVLKIDQDYRKIPILVLGWLSVSFHVCVVELNSQV